MTVSIEKTSALAAPLATLKAYLRITGDEEDDLLTDMIHAATDVAERFLGQLLVERGVTELVDPVRDWRALAIRPVTALTAVLGLSTDGDAVPLPVDAYAIDIDGQGDGWLRVSDAGDVVRIRVEYRAGMASDPEAIPDSIRHGIVRLAGDYHAMREGVEARPPAAVAALWAPWRRMRLT